jgi:DNA-binding CsgD family transcriptional regulator
MAQDEDQAESLPPAGKAFFVGDGILLQLTVPLMELVNSRSEPGIIIFNLKKQITYANQIALETFNPDDSIARGDPSVGNLKIPSEISHIHAELKARLIRFAWNSCPDAVYLKKVVPIRNTEFIIRGFIISDSQNRSSAHFLVLIDKLSVRSKINLEPARFYYKLSSKEFEVVQLLIGGHTNKEIANRLEIAESTVKEYMRKILRKARSATRAGVVSKMLSRSIRDAQDGESGEETALSPTLRSRVLFTSNLGR